MKGSAAFCAIALLALSACKREPSFDERYAGAEKAVREKAAELDRDMARRASDAPPAEASDAVVPGRT